MRNETRDHRSIAVFRDDERATTDTYINGRAHAASVARAMQILRREYVPCAIKNCSRSASHVDPNDHLVCHNHYRRGGQSIAAARERLRAAMAR